MIGQINLDCKMGALIYEYASKNDINTIFEIGTWNGEGSTYCIYKSLIDHNKLNVKFITLETDESMYNKAVSVYSNLLKLNDFNIILGRLINKDELINLNNIDDSMFFDYPRNIKQQWLDSDINNYDKIKDVSDIIPEFIDLLILDGGEFSTYAEFNKLKFKSKYIFIDDTKCIKSFKIKNDIKESNDFTIIEDSDERNGFLLIKNNKI
jgi:hypothetical protein